MRFSLLFLAIYMQLNTVTSLIVKNQPVTLEGNHMFDQDTKSGIFPRISYKSDAFQGKNFISEYPFADYLRLAMQLNQALDKHEEAASPSILPGGVPIFTRDQVDSI